MVERSAAAREAQRSTLALWPDGATHGDEVPATLDGVIVANELLDAMPVHQVVMMSSGLREVYVDLDADRLVTREGPVSSPAIPRYLSSAGVELAPGSRAEVSLAAVDWVREAARRLGRGFMILIDYGDEARSLYSEARASGTLGTYRGHRFVGGDTGAPWVEHPGEQDITAHVDFSSVRAAAETEGCTTLGLMDQTYFLMALARPYLDSFDERERRAFKSLVVPGGLGSTMKVLLLAKDVGAPALLGCSGPSRLT
jgi:SAM-dependent MidA family methyltransferase